MERFLYTLGATIDVNIFDLGPFRFMSINTLVVKFRLDFKLTMEECIVEKFIDDMTWQSDLGPFLLLVFKCLLCSDSQDFSHEFLAVLWLNSPDQRPNEITIRLTLAWLPVWQI